VLANVVINKRTRRSREVYRALSEAVPERLEALCTALGGYFAVKKGDGYTVAKCAFPGPVYATYLNVGGGGAVVTFRSAAGKAYTLALKGSAAFREASMYLNLSRGEYMEALVADHGDEVQIEVELQ